MPENQPLTVRKEARMVYEAFSKQAAGSLSGSHLSRLRAMAPGEREIGELHTSRDNVEATEPTS